LFLLDRPLGWSGSIVSSNFELEIKIDRDKEKVEVVQNMDNSGPSSELGPVAASSSQPIAATPQSDTGNVGLSNGGSTARRHLRARPSEPSTSWPVTKRARSDTNTKLRPPTEKELGTINAALSEEALIIKRNGVIRDKEAELKVVVDKHDDAVREKFHLERFISIFEGYDPKVCLDSREAMVRADRRRVSRQITPQSFLRYVTLTSDRRRLLIV
jgi:hypothetical protein